MPVSYQYRYLSDFVKNRTYLSNIEKVYAHHISNEKPISPTDYNRKINDFIDKISRENAVNLYFNVYPHWIIKNRFGLEIQKRINHGITKYQKEANDFSQKIITSKSDYIKFVPVHNDIKLYIEALENGGYEFENDFGVLIIRLR